jgi:hypothetical protein
VANKAGISTPVPAAPAQASSDAALMTKLDAMDLRLARIERAVADLQSLILATRNN